MNAYLKPNRLMDIVGILQFMSNYRKYKLLPDEWETKADYQPKSAISWKELFSDHPEFFRVNSNGEVSLIWRKALPHDDESRQPLTQDQVSTLINAALEFHAKAVEQKRDMRWWIPVAVAFLAFAGALLGAYIRTVDG
jgi:hypothetical protein